MADIRIKDLPINASPSPSQYVATDLATTQKLTVQALVDIGVPVASQAEAEAGVQATKRMTPLTTAQAITARAATPAQGALADSAIQPGDLSAVATTGNYNDLSNQPTLSADLIYPVKANAIAATIPSIEHSLRINGSVTLGDGLGGLYIDTNNGSADTFVSSGGTSRTWYRAPDVSGSRLFSVDVNTGTGLTGGGSLAADLTLALNAGSIASLAKADSAVQPARNLMSFPTRAAAAAVNLTGVAEVEIVRWSSGSRSARAVYGPVGTEPTHEMKFQDSAGTWFEFQDPTINLYQAGAMGGGVVDDTTAIQRAINYAKGFGVEGKTRSILLIPSEQFLHTGLLIDRAIEMWGSHRGSTLLANIGITVPGVIVKCQHDGFDYYNVGAPPCRVVMRGIILKHINKNDVPGRNVSHALSLQNAATNGIYTVFEGDLEIFSPPGDGISAIAWNGHSLIHKLYANGAYRDNFSINSCYDWRVHDVDLLYAGNDGAVISGCAGIHLDGFKSYTNVKRGLTIYDTGGIGRNTILNIGIDTNGEDGVVITMSSPKAPWVFIGGNIGNNSQSSYGAFDDVRINNLTADGLIRFTGGFAFDPTQAVDGTNYKSRHSIHFDGSSGAGTVDIRGSFIGVTNPVHAPFNFTNDTARIIGAAAVVPYYGKVLSTGSSAGFRVANPANNTQFDELGFGGLYSSTKGGNRASWDGNGTAWSDQFRLVPGPYADDAAAAAGGVQLLGGLYRKTDGTVRWRLT